MSILRVHDIQRVLVQHAVTPGQVVVFYQGEKVLGGAIIEREVSAA